MYVLVIKILAQILVLTVGLISAWQAHSVSKTGTGKRKLNRVGWLTISMLLAGFAVFIATEASQQDTIVELRQSLLAIRADHEISAIEISFKPSDEHWTRIAAKFNQIKSPAGEDFPYRAGTMRAQRTADAWRFDFGEIKDINGVKGVIKPAPVLPGAPENKAFESVLSEAWMALWIKWGAGVESEIEPLGNEFAPAIEISRDRITMTLRSPMTMPNAKSLVANPSVFLRTLDQPKALRFHALDSVIVLDQTIALEWKEDRSSGDSNEIIKRTKPFISGPHTLQISFRP